MNIGLIGCGHIAHYHADVLIALGNNICAVSARPNSKKIGPFAKKFGIEKIYYNWQDMVQKESLDALWIMVNWEEIDELVIPLINTKINLFIEKPVGISSRIIKDALNAQSLTNQYIQIGYNRRFYSFIRNVRNIVDSGNLRSVLVEIPESVDMKNEKLAKNLWILNSSHVIDLVHFIFGPIEIKYKNLRSFNKEKYNSSFNAILETKDKIPIHLISEWNTSNNFGITIFVDDKCIVLKPLENVKVYQGFNVVEPTIANPLRLYNPKLINSFQSDNNYKPGFLEQAEHFMKKVNNNLSDNTLNNYGLSNALEVTRLIESLLDR